ncbi:hypothetical protein NDN08_005810 [Rhodosorus marinus]|uniref:S5 DRBM domain-containing protein n=1 Tax=Rhodosorus marinus TaxID=101924 RepID=A0AAV8V3B3_9RHOD|nr:hypothetical protein NDN08_005810 [Rhodosorus marinus]
MNIVGVLSRSTGLREGTGRLWCRWMSESGGKASTKLQLEELRVLPMYAHQRFRKESRGGPFRTLNGKSGGVDMDWAFKDLHRLGHLEAALSEHVEFLRSEGDEKLDELRYAKIQRCLAKTRNRLNGYCGKLNITTEELLNPNLNPVDVPRSVMNWEQQMELYDIQDELREYLFQMDKLEPQESCISAAYKFLAKLPERMDEKKVIDDRDIGIEKYDIDEDELARNEKELRESVDTRFMIKGFHTALLELKKTAHSLASGRIRTFSAVVAVGNLNGTGGIGHGNATSAGEACQRATRDALKRLVYVERYQGRTLHYALANNGAPKFEMWPLQAGLGLRCWKGFIPMLALLGFKDVGGRIRPCQSNLKMLRGCRVLLRMLAAMKTPKQIAEDRGLKATEISEWHRKALAEADELRAIRQLDSKLHGAPEAPSEITMR